MATREQVANLQQMLNRVNGSIQQCHEIAVALMETGSKWSWNGHPIGWITGTDYDRARLDILNMTTAARRLARSIRRSQISPQAIRAEALLKQLNGCCRKCPSYNAQAVRQGKPFTCLAQTGPEARNTSRFALNQKGQIIEQK